MENRYLYKGHFAGHELDFAFYYPETALYFGSYLNSSKGASMHAIHVDQNELLSASKKWNMPCDGNLEFCLSMYKASDELMRFSRFIFHGAAFLLNGKAFLISAESGIGKTTQIKNWMSLYSEQIVLINGDKPILQLNEDNSIIVHPSPWKGKEDWGNDTYSGKLGGIILLRRGSVNSIMKASAVHNGARLFSLFFSSFEKAEYIEAISRIETAMWRTIPIWNLKNTGDTESAELAYKAITGE